jgi:hypothetical protein
MSTVMKNPIHRIAIVASALLASACGDAVDAGNDEAEPDDEVSYSFNCNEARGALYTFEQMVVGRERVNQGRLGQAESSLRRLAEEKQAPVSIMSDLDAWRAAVVAHSLALTSWQPTFMNGRFAEPDTTQIDRKMLDSVRPLGERIDAWVAQMCGRV